MIKGQCEICRMFDCGQKCQCKCHYGSTDKIRQDLDPRPRTEAQAMEGLSTLFG